MAEDRRTSNLETFGFDLPLPPGQSIPPKIGPVDVFDARLKASTPLFDPAGIARVLVNGTTIVDDGKPTGERPGLVLRSGADTNTPPLR